MTFKDLCFHRHIGATVHDMTLAGAYLESLPESLQNEVWTETIFSGELLEALRQWLQAPTATRQDRLLNLLRQSAESLARDAIEDEINSLNRSEGRCNAHAQGY